MQASEGSFMGSNGAGRPSERPRQGSGKPLPRADSSKPSPATASQRSTHDRRQLFQHDQLRAQLWAPRMSRFRGYRVILVNVPKFCVKRASNLYVSAAKSAQARNTESGLCFFSFRMVCPPSALASRGQIELQGVGSALGRINKKTVRI